MILELSQVITFVMFALLIFCFLYVLYWLLCTKEYEKNMDKILKKENKVGK